MNKTEHNPTSKSNLIAVIIALISAVGAVSAAFVSANASFEANEKVDVIRNSDFLIGKPQPLCDQGPSILIEKCSGQVDENGFIVLTASVDLDQDASVFIFTGDSMSDMELISSSSASHRANTVLVSSNSSTIPVSKGTSYLIEAKTDGNNEVEGTVTVLFLPLKFSTTVN